MFIQTELTPNPLTLKFIPGCPVTGGAPVDFLSTTEAEAGSSLARSLFAVSGVKAVFLGSDFITVTRTDETDWPLLKPAVLGAIMQHFLSGLPVLDPEPASVTAIASSEDDEIVSQIKELLETRVRPAVAQDGGDITFRGFDRGVVYLDMKGSCAGCPSSTATLKVGIENLLRHYIPEVIEVRAA